jgi:hypothetical protein
VTRPSASELLATPGGLLTRGHLQELGLSRRAVDAVFRALPNVYFDGFSRPHVKVEDYVAYVERSTTTENTVR